MNEAVYGRYVRETDAWNADQVLVELADAWLDARGADHALYSGIEDWADDAGYDIRHENRDIMVDMASFPPRYGVHEDAMTVTGDLVSVRYRVYWTRGEIIAEPRPVDPMVSIGDTTELSDRDDLLLHHVTAYFDDDSVLAETPGR